MSVIYKMTDEVAFELGKFDFPCFYSYAIWKVNKEPFPLVKFFTWSLPYGIPVSSSNDGSYTTLWDQIGLQGKLKTEEIKEISHKLAYIRGRLQSYSIKITENEISIYYANSYDFRDFMAECLNDVLYDKFFLLPQVEGKLGRKFQNNILKFSIEKSETVGTIPGTPSVTLKADKEVINYILGR